MTEPLQFGEPAGEFITRNTAYAVITNNRNEVLVVDVNGTYHLPGGGIDEGEDILKAVERELIEETGCKAKNLTLLGNANQFYFETKLGPMNKLATFFSGKLLEQNKELTQEEDHIPKWVSIDEIMSSTMAGFQKWAISEATK